VFEGAEFIEFIPLRPKAIKKEPDGCRYPRCFSRTRRRYEESPKCGKPNELLRTPGHCLSELAENRLRVEHGQEPTGLNLISAEAEKSHILWSFSFSPSFSATGLPIVPIMPNKISPGCSQLLARTARQSASEM
jgi:hypothetical protein